MLFRLATIFIQHLLNHNSFFFTFTHNGQMYVNKAICESFAAINVQMVARIKQLSNTNNVPNHTKACVSSSVFVKF